MKSLSETSSQNFPPHWAELGHPPQLGSVTSKRKWRDGLGPSVDKLWMVEKNSAGTCFEHKVLLGHSHARSYSYQLGLFLGENGKVGQLWQKPSALQSVTYLLPGSVHKVVPLLTLTVTHPVTLTTKPAFLQQEEKLQMTTSNEFPTVTYKILTYMAS